MPLHDVNQVGDFATRKATILRLVRKNIDLVESDPTIILVALMELTCLYLVTELFHLPWKEVRTQSFELFRKSLDEVHKKATQVQANDGDSQ